MSYEAHERGKRWAFHFWSLCGKGVCGNVVLCGDVHMQSFIRLTFFSENFRVCCYWCCIFFCGDGTLSPLLHLLQRCSGCFFLLLLRLTRRLPGTHTGVFGFWVSVGVCHLWLHSINLWLPKFSKLHLITLSLSLSYTLWIFFLMSFFPWFC